MEQNPLKKTSDKMHLVEEMKTAARDISRHYRNNIKTVVNVVDRQKRDVEINISEYNVCGFNPTS